MKAVLVGLFTKVFRLSWGSVWWTKFRNDSIWFSEIQKPVNFRYLSFSKDNKDYNLDLPYNSFWKWFSFIFQACKDFPLRYYPTFQGYVLLVLISMIHSVFKCVTWRTVVQFWLSKNSTFNASASCFPDFPSHWGGEKRFQLNWCQKPNFSRRQKIMFSSKINTLPCNLVHARSVSSYKHFS